jgi:hypothetical protein
MEPYDAGNSRAILGSFLPPGAPILATYFGSDFPVLRRTAWSRLLDGDRGAIIWDDDPDRAIQKSSPDMPITARGRSLRDIFAEIRPAAERLAPLERVRDRVAIHYSQASIRAWWMSDSREDGNTWPRRLASYELEHSRLIPIRAAYVKAVEDLGLAADFVSYEQIESGELRRGKYRALLLPGSIAMSQAECDRIAEFARDGGVVIGDERSGVMDEHCRRVPADRRQAFYAAVDRRGPAAIGERFQKAGIAAPLLVTGARDIKVWRRAGPDGRMIIALMRNPAAAKSTATVRVRVKLPTAMRVRNGGRDVGAGREFDVEVGPTSPTLLDVRAGR